MSKQEKYVRQIFDQEIQRAIDEEENHIFILWLQGLRDRILSVIAPRASLEDGTPLPAHDEWPKRCPTCDSPDPKRHPAMQFEGEVQPCSDPFHLSAEIGKTKNPIDTRAAPPGGLARVVRKDGPFPPPLDEPNLRIALIALQSGDYYQIYCWSCGWVSNNLWRTYKKAGEEGQRHECGVSM